MLPSHDADHTFATLPDGASRDIFLISTAAADWSREEKKFWQWIPSRSLLASIRSYQRHAGRPGPWHVLIRKFAVLRHHFWSAICGCDIPVTCQLGGGLLIPHPNGIVIHPGAKIGPNCLLFQQVTIGTIHDGIPVIGAHVDIGAGAKILGPVTIGDNALIGANAVVLKDVPAGATAVGVPAHILARL